MTDTPTRDPGWGVSKGSFLLILLPGGMRFVARKNGPQVNGLVVLRQVFLSFMTAAFLIGLVAFLIVRGEPAKSRALWIALTIALSVGAAIVVRILEPKLDCSSTRALGETYRNRLFIRVAAAQAGQLFGFVATIASGVWWIYFVGLLLAVPAYWRAAPSVRNVARDEDRLVLQGCAATDIVAAFQPSPG